MGEKKESILPKKKKGVTVRDLCSKGEGGLHLGEKGNAAERKRKDAPLRRRVARD